MAGLPNQAPVNLAMLKELELKFRCDPLVAELACRKVNFESLELAVDFIYGPDPMNLHKHPFVPFQINERELDAAQAKLEDSTKALNQDALIHDLKSPCSLDTYLDGIGELKKGSRLKDYVAQNR